jgi:hypothetical protein
VSVHRWRYSSEHTFVLFRNANPGVEQPWI